jgi:hypothetical protein
VHFVGFVLIYLKRFSFEEEFKKILRYVCKGLPVKYSSFLSDLMKFALSRQILEKIQTSNFVKIRPVGAELFNADGLI